jgi:hypothetical protein
LMVDCLPILFFFFGCIFFGPAFHV